MTQYRKNTRACFLLYNEGDYFITICTKDRRHHFGEILNGKMYLSAIGKYVDSQLASAHSFNPNIEILLSVVMPNHIHAIVQVLDVSSEEYMPPLQRSPNYCLRAFPERKRSVPELTRYINSFKGAVTKYARSLGVDFHWQDRYNDHCIRGIHDGNRIAEYIMTNIENWNDDSYNG